MSRTCRQCTKTLPQASRPQRLKEVVTELTRLSQEYEAWLQALPENLEQSELAGQLEETVEQLDQARDLLSDVDLPKGFGR